MRTSRQPRPGTGGPTDRPANDPRSARAQDTWPQQRSAKARHRAKAARVHTLTDPLGAKGFRATGQRIRHGTSARRTVLLASVATFAASFGVIVATNHLPTNADPATTTTQPTATTTTSQASSSSGGAALDRFPGQAANGVTGAADASSSTTTTTMRDDQSEGDDHENEDNSFLTTQPYTSSSSQLVTSNGKQTTTTQTSTQTAQSSLSQQPVPPQPSHTRSGGSSTSTDDRPDRRRCLPAGDGSGTCRTALTTWPGGCVNASVRVGRTTERLAAV